MNHLPEMTKFSLVFRDIQELVTIHLNPSFYITISAPHNFSNFRSIYLELRFSVEIEPVEVTTYQTKPPKKFQTNPRMDRYHNATYYIQRLSS